MGFKITPPSSDTGYEVYVLQLLGAKLISRAEAREALGIEGQPPHPELF